MHRLLRPDEGCRRRRRGGVPAAASLSVACVSSLGHGGGFLASNSFNRPHRERNSCLAAARPGGPMAPLPGACGGDCPAGLVASAPSGLHSHCPFRTTFTGPEGYIGFPPGALLCSLFSSFHGSQYTRLSCLCSTEGSGGCLTASMLLLRLYLSPMPLT